MNLLNNLIYKFICVFQLKSGQHKKTYRPQARWGYITPTHIVCRYCSYRYGLHTKYLKYENTDQEWIFILPLKQEHKHLVCGVCRRGII